MYKMYKEYFLVILLFILGCHVCDGIPKVTLKQGVVLGTHQTSYDGRIISAFIGIPYGKPPTGNLRFKDPIAASGWKGPLTANKSYICSQLDETNSVVGSEDCLYVYVYVPRENINRNDNLDVVVHIHGGSLVSGDPDSMAQPDYLLDQDVIMVTMNYRLGAAGFLSTGDHVVPGNNGFKDQTLALKWIKNNIKEFGGNPESVTITGWSSGGSSVEFHYLSPLSRGLFKRGYSSSYVVTSSESLTLIPLEKTKTLAQQLQCPVDPVSNMVECLRRMPIEKLVNTSIWFKPVVEKGNPNPFIPDIPYKILKDKKVYDVTWVASNMINESLFSLDSLYKDRTEIFSICGNWTEWAKVWLDLEEYVDKDKLENTLNKIKKYYLNDCKLTEANGLEKLNKLMTDRHFLVGSDLALRAQSAATKSPVYYYLFSFIPEDRLEFGGPPAASHGVDNKMLFKFRTNPDRLKMQDEKMMRLLTKFMAGYAKTGIPKIGGINWVPINPDQCSLNVLEIKSPKDIKMSNFRELAPTHFWDSLPIKENNHLLK